jgi:succinate dehydrogenase / fumarate reductase, cytochrome b subunit
LTDLSLEQLGCGLKIMFNFFQSSLGKKYVMAITGLALFGFVIMHMLGNLQIFLGPDVINSYAAFLQSKPELLWTARSALLVLVVLHIVSAVQLSALNRRARPVNYGEYKIVAASYASRTMLMSGLIVLAFIIYHLLHFTVALPGVNLLTQSEAIPQADFRGLHDLQGRHDVFRMMVLGFSNLWVSGFYIIGMALLCMHLGHGVSSMFQSLGLKTQRFGGAIDRLATLSAIIIFIGNVSIPVAVLLGYGR